MHESGRERPDVTTFALLRRERGPCEARAALRCVVAGAAAGARSSDTVSTYVQASYPCTLCTFIVYFTSVLYVISTYVLNLAFT